MILVDLQSENWASDGDESSVDWRASVSGLDSVGRGQESDGCTSSDVGRALGVQSQGGESLDWELGVA